MSLIVSLYSLLIAVFCGAFICDIVYSRLVANIVSVSARDALFRNVSDLLLEIAVLVFLS